MFSTLSRTKDAGKVHKHCIIEMKYATKSSSWEIFFHKFLDIACQCIEFLFLSLIFPSLRHTFPSIIAIFKLSSNEKRPTTKGDCNEEGDNDT